MLLASPSPLPPTFRGLALALHDRDPRRSYRREVREIRALGANAIALLTPWDMPHARAARVVAGAATREQLRDALREARAQGLAVLLGSLVHLEQRGPRDWRGSIAPPDWDLWFASYEELLLEQAGLAEREGASALLIGSELCSTEAMEQRWRALIQRVRGIYRGPISYQTNWDHRLTPRFLDALDFLATNAYFELSDAASPRVDDLVRAWAPYREELLAWASAHGKPLVITEVGYPSQRGALSAPWDYTREAAVDLEQQRRGYEAFFRAWNSAPGLSGYFFYEWWGEGGTQDRGYTPRGKPAGDLVRRWFADGGPRP